MLRRFRDPLTYPDLAGRRKLRGYVLAALVILMLVAGILALGKSQQAGVQAVLEATSRPVSQAVQAVSPTPIPVPTSSPTPEGCPDDSAQWVFQNVFPGDNYKRIEPSCVYDNLAKTVAWHMLERLGYTKPEANQRLGFANLPWQPGATLTGLTNTQGPMPIYLTMEWAPHPDYHYWTLDAEGNPGLVYSLRGCYRTRDFLGNEAEFWDTRHVHCVVAVDYTPGWVVNQLGEDIYAANWSVQPPTRAFVMFGYTDAGTWVLLGELQGQQVSLENAGHLPGEQESTAARYGAQVWDAQWLEDTFGLTMHPLPENWQTFTDPAGIQAISNALNAFDWQPLE